MGSSQMPRDSKQQWKVLLYLESGLGCDKSLRLNPDANIQMHMMVDLSPTIRLSSACDCMEADARED